MVDPLSHAPANAAEVFSGEEQEDPSELHRQLEELESELASREEECRHLQKTVEEKDARLDLLDNKIKVMRIEVAMETHLRRRRIARRTRRSRCWTRRTLC